MSTITISVDDAFERCCAALIGSGTSEDNARITADALVRAECDGQKGHGLARIPSYAAQARSGKVRGEATPELIDVKQGLFRVNAGYGFAYPAIDLALSELPRRVQKLGIGAAAIYQSHHFGVAGHPCEDLARQGFIAFVYGNTPKAIAPFGAREKVLGTNPVAFAAPVRNLLFVTGAAPSTWLAGGGNECVPGSGIWKPSLFAMRG